MVEGKSAFVLGSSYELPTSVDLLDISYINELKDSPNFNPVSFLREYGSVWSGSSESSLVDLESFRKSRILKTAETKAVKDKDFEYILSFDVARSEGSANAQSALVVIKVKKRGDGTFSKHVVNIYTFEGTHFREQAMFLKEKVNDFRARVLVLDSNGLGQGLVDYLISPDLDTNPPYEVINDDRYRKYKTSESVLMIYTVKSQTKEQKASDIHNLFIRWVGNNQVKFLESESNAKMNYKGKDENIAEHLRPFTMTDFLQEEVMNLEYKQSGINTDVKRISNGIQKDRFSALEYGLFWIYLEEKKNKLIKDEDMGDPSKYFVGRSVNFNKRKKKW